MFVLSPSDEKSKDVRESGTGSVSSRRVVFLLRERVDVVGVVSSQEKIFESEKKTTDEIQCERCEIERANT